jgi:hypothetical protein
MKIAITLAGVSGRMDKNLVAALLATEVDA